MYLYAEVWKARQAWLDLPFEDRQAYLANAGQSIGPVFGLAGVETLITINEAEVAHRANYRYLMAWKLPDAEAMKQLQDAVEAAGWHKYFEQTNAGGEVSEIGAIFKDMLTL